MYFADRLTIDAPKRLQGGYVAVRAKAARVGVYQYAGFEIDPQNAHGLRDKAVVNVLRDDATVFDAPAVRSFIGKPVTDDHPATAVNADNWRDHARGTIMGAMRDGEYLAFDLLLTDRAIIDAVTSGKRELSNGYSAELEFGDFKAPDGTICDARQSKITDGNHVAIVDRGRAGPECRIADTAPWATCDAIPADQFSATTQDKEPVMATLTIDGLPISLADEAAVRAVIAKKDAAIAAAETELADAKTALTTEQGKTAALESQLADAKDAATPAALDKLVADRAALIGKVKAVAPNITTDGKTDAEIRRAAVAAKLGDAAKDMDDAAIAGAFAVLSATDAKPVTIHNIAPATPVADAAATVATLRTARYA